MNRFKRILIVAAMSIMALGANAYPWLSPYVYCMNNPVKFVDPDGRKSLLIIWTSSQTQYGHAAFAVQEYNNKGQALSTYTVYGLFPLANYTSTDAVKDERVRALFRISHKTTLERIKKGDFNSGESSKPDGILEINSDYDHDKEARATMQNEIKQNKGYSGASRNCATYAREGVRAATGNSEISGEESIMFSSFVTPNQLYKDTKSQNNVNTVVDAENKTDYMIDERVNLKKQVK